MAIAPERTGIGIRRHFTKPGSDPYGTVTWERRDARITNWATGAVAFEQLGVEVPSEWSVNATNILAQKYFRGTLGTPEREWSLKQVADRVVGAIVAWGQKDGYFVDDQEAEAFEAELKWLIVHQRAAFNSPVWFNLGVAGVPQQASACFILSVDDSMDSILNWYVEEGKIFKGGSGAGINLSRIRSSMEGLRGGGTASGPVSFMRGADASAGTIKSGGKTRRAAKMVILDAWHPDIENFIWCKAIEERKARALKDAGFDMDLDGKDSHSVQYQNANNSVRVTDEFMQAVVDGTDWQLKAVGTGEVLKTMKARDLFRQIAKAAWECADPGMQFDTTINKWHTASATGRINASNPCFTGDALVHTDKGLIAFRELFARANDGESFAVYTHDATRPGAPAQRLELTTPEALMISGYNEVVELRFDNGMEVRCTPGHRFFTLNRGYVEARDLGPDDDVKVLDLPAPAVSASYRLPVLPGADGHVHRANAGTVSSAGTNVPEKWDHELAHYLGWMAGVGSVGADGTLEATYGGPEDQAEILPRHLKFATWMNGGVLPEVSGRAGGAVRVRLCQPALAELFTTVGLGPDHGAQRRAPWSVFQAPAEILATFLRGLFDAAGQLHHDGPSATVSLRSSSRELLVDVQRLLSTFGVPSSVRGPAGEPVRAEPVRTGPAGPSGAGDQPAPGHCEGDQLEQHELCTGPGGAALFAREIGSDLPSRAAGLEQAAGGRAMSHDACSAHAHLMGRTEKGFETTYNLSEPRNHSYVVNGLVVRNCSEYMHLDNSACNLASLNLLSFLGPDGNFDVEGFKAAIEVVFTAQEVLIGNADYPTEAISVTSRRFRQLGLGYANLGALLMAQGLPYDSPAGRAWAGAITALMTGHAYAVSARTAARMGPFAGYHDNSEPMLGVLRMHRAQVAEIDEGLVPTELLCAAHEAWESAVGTAELFGVRNSQATVLAPTGCLVGGSLVPTERGLVRLGSLGDPEGAKWQPLGLRVGTDEGPRTAEQFYVNGLEPVVTVRTSRGYQVRGTAQHRVRVVGPEGGQWRWKRLSDVRAGDLVPLALDQVIGQPREVPLPCLEGEHCHEAEHASTEGPRGERRACVPVTMTAELAELVGLSMGGQPPQRPGLRVEVPGGGADAVERVRLLAKCVFGSEVVVTEQHGRTEVRLGCEKLASWWEACGFARQPADVVAAREDHGARASRPHVPGAVLDANDRGIYAAFLRGVLRAGGAAPGARATFQTTCAGFARDLQSLLLALGYPAALDITERAGAGGVVTVAELRVLAVSRPEQWSADIGLIGAPEEVGAGHGPGGTSSEGSEDLVPLHQELMSQLGAGSPSAGQEHPAGMVPRRAAAELYARARDAELGKRLGFFYDTVSSAGPDGEELTYDLAVPSNVTYIANGFVSHNTIGLLMDCDTTGIEPDLGLVKTKKLVGGGTMSIVNQTVPRALRRLGYPEDEVSAILAYIDEHKTIIGAPHISPDHLAVFACSMGDNAIHYGGHVRMMAAAQPFISGAISKTVNMPEEATVEDVEQLHVDAWQMGIKAVAIYRDNCKVAQPLSATKKTSGPGVPVVSEPEAHDAELAMKVAELEKALAAQAAAAKQPVHEHMPRRRKSSTFSFRVADCEGYVTVGEFDDGRPGEVFISVSKQGSTLAGIMDAFAISVSMGLQHGVPLATFVRHFTNMRFEPAGMTDDPDLRFASSLVDYIFRRLAVEYMSPAERMDLGILTVSERMQPTLPGVEEAVTLDHPLGPGLVGEVELRDGRGPLAPGGPGTSPPGKTGPAGAGTSEPPGPARRPAAPNSAAPSGPVPSGPVPSGPVSSDAPYCYQCGVQMQRAGSCFACPSCGTTSGCS
jgi:ribonucleoside-diphosphate reductase alpha chain